MAAADVYLIPQIDNPFIGLRPFDSDQAPLFFGRSEQSAELLRRLNDPRFLAVVGSSGCGKSSLIRAGLIPNLQAGLMVDERDQWFVATMKPEDRPRCNLAEALLRTLPHRPADSDIEALTQALLETGTQAVVDALGQALNEADANLLLLVDQFEEIFPFGVHTADPERRSEAADFVSLMLTLAEQRDIPAYVVMTMRSDFLGECDAFRGLPEAMNRSQYLVPRLNRRQLRNAIEGPVRLGGKAVAPRLIDRLLNDVGDESDELPVLQHALMRLWEQAESDRSDVLDLDHYRKIGTLEYALSRHADDALASVDRRLAERVFKALTHNDANNRRIRRSLPLHRLQAETGASVDALRPIIEAFRRRDRSFLMPPPDEALEGKTLISISHESLIRQWETLTTWVDLEAESGRRYRRYAEDAARGSPLTDLNLADALEWRDHSHHNKAWAERYGARYAETLQFIEHSQEHEQQRIKVEQQRQQELEQSRRRVQILLTLGLVVALLLGSFALLQTFDAQREKDRAEAEAVNAHKQTLEANFNLAQLFEEKAKLILGAAKKEADIQGYQHAWLYTLAAMSQQVPDEKRLPASVGQLMLPELAQNAFRSLWSSQSSRPFSSVSFSPDGKTLASGSDDQTIRLWEVSSGKALSTLSGHSSSVTSVAYSPDGKTLASGSADQTIRLWEVSSGKALSTLSGHSSSVTSVAYSPDGKTLASGSADQTIRLWEVSSGRALSTLSGHSSRIWSVSFSPDGKTLASGSYDRTIRLWEVSSGKGLATLSGHSESVFSVSFSPDGKTLASGSEDQTIRFWQADILIFLAIKPPNDPIFEELYQASRHALGYRMNGIDLERDLPLYLSPVNGYQFPQPRRFQKLDRPRPLDQDPLAWLLENIKAR